MKVLEEPTNHITEGKKKQCFAKIQGGISRNL